VPTTTPAAQGGRGVRSLGGEVVLFGDSYSDAYTHSPATLEKETRA